MEERLREKLELEKRALKVVERLLEDSVAEDFLIDCVCIRQTAVGHRLSPIYLGIFYTWFLRNKI